MSSECSHAIASHMSPREARTWFSLPNARNAKDVGKARTRSSSIVGKEAVAFSAELISQGSRGWKGVLHKLVPFVVFWPVSVHQNASEVDRISRCAVKVTKSGNPGYQTASFAAWNIA